MSQTCNLKNPVAFMRFAEDMDINALTEFVGDEGTVCLNSGGVALAFGGPYNAEDLVELEDDDVLVRIAGEIEVYTAEAFEETFDEVS